MPDKEETVRYTPSIMVGRESVADPNFRAFKESKRVTGIEFYYDKGIKSLRGIAVTLSDGTRSKHGTLSGSKSAVQLGVNDLVDATIYSSDWETGRCGGLKLEITKPGGVIRTFEVGEGRASSIGSGILAGVFGWSGDDLDALGLYYERQVTGYYLKNVKYDLDNRTSDGKGELRTIDEAWIVNRDPESTLAGEFSGTTQITRTHSWSSQFSIKAGVTVGGKVGLPLVAEGKVSISVETGFSHTWGESTSESDSRGYKISPKVPPLSKVRCFATVTKSQVRIPYTGTAELTYDDGVKIEKPEKGLYEGVQQHSVQAEGGKAQPLTEAEKKQLATAAKKSATPAHIDGKRTIVLGEMPVVAA